jgi:PmbA protein
VLDHARAKGASAAETEVSEGFGHGVNVRRGEVENIEYNRDKSIGITAYLGQRKGSAGTSDFSPKALTDTVAAAVSIARFTASDDCAGLAEPELMAREIHDLDLFHPWDLPIEEAIERARACEAAAFALDPRIVNSEGAGVSTQQQQFVVANSNGFAAGYPTTRHYLSCAVIAAQNGAMQRDDWYAEARAARDLPSGEAVGTYAGQRALARLGSRKLKTMKVPVLFEAPVATGLLGGFVGAVSGGSLYRKTSFLLDSLGKQVFSPLVQLSEQPHLRKGLASGYFDDDGVATHPREVVKDGVLQGYFLGTYSARKLGMRTTGNAGGSHNLILQSGGLDLPGLLKTMGRGLLVTELMGQGINMVTGDYSRGAAGYWVEGGEIRYPVEEITIAGNLRDMFKGIAAVGKDELTRGSRRCGSILIDSMTIAGN